MTPLFFAPPVFAGKFRAGLLGALLFLAAPQSVSAQTITNSPAYEAAFQAMMADPGNLDKTFAYADAAITAGDYEGAIAALERMLFINPELPRVRLELATLYFRLGSYETARSYFLSVRDQKEAPPEVRERVESFLGEIDKRQSKHKWSGSVFAGARWQSNANTATQTGNVSVLGLSATLDSQFTQKKDWNAFGVVNAKHSYEIDAGSSDTWDTTLTGYMARQAAQKDVDVSFFEMTTGPQLRVFPASEYEIGFRPYLVSNYVAIDDVRDYFGIGAGGTLSVTLNPLTLTEWTAEMRDKRSRDSFKSPTKSERDGIERLVRARLVRVLTQDISLQFGAGVAHQEGDKDFWSYWEYSVTAGASYSFPSPFSDSLDMRWNLTASVTRVITDYEDPDPTIDSTITRFDRDWRFSLTQSVPLTKDWTLIGVLARNLRGSSLPNYQYTNNSATIGASYRF